ncbi:hypothetical protein [Xenorhabdus innexi]|uniref:Uncharacterized protein n=1 Tax=Xenorhabdus innexi TaxID=290109 RepID=A0A1N6MQ78_9GAMM|nr:hypothetical protein [Xenorhabdus innexi]PHM31280.1 hypothetical protein Xinn_02921 [Xenorhabdus innexi]SIP70970.1 conserved hypothetical protein [Xenorhabdus innexi]
MIKADKYQPTGDASVGYPQICIRTNRTAERTDMKPVIERAMNIGQQFPWSEKDTIIREVFKELGSAFGGGSFGHAWVIYFNSSKEGDNTSYAFHAGYGLVKNSEYTNDSPERKFHLQRCVKVDGNAINPELIEMKLIPKLIDESNRLSKLMKLTSEDMKNGVYTPITNCSWFAGNLWNQIIGLKFEQTIENDINLNELAVNMDLPLINEIRGIGDPGMLAESIENGLHI